MLLSTRFTEFLFKGNYGYVKDMLTRRTLRDVPLEIREQIQEDLTYPFESLVLKPEYKDYALQIIRFLKEQLKNYQYHAHVEHIELIEKGRWLREQDHKKYQQYLEGCWKIQAAIDMIVEQI